MIFKQYNFRVIWKDANGWQRATAKSVEFGPAGATKAIVKTDAAEDVIIAINWGNAFLLQFAGGFDKNAVPIYHGDILKDRVGMLHEVVSIFGGYAILEEGMDPIYLTDDFCRKCEVVGNAVENEGMADMPVNLEAIFGGSEETFTTNEVEEPIAESTIVKEDGMTTVTPRVYTLKKKGA